MQARWSQRAAQNEEVALPEEVVAIHHLHVRLHGRGVGGLRDVVRHHPHPEPLPTTCHGLADAQAALELIAEAKEAGLPTIVWAYPRGGGLSKEGETAIDVVMALDGSVVSLS